MDTRNTGNPPLDQTNATIIWGCGHRKAFLLEADSQYPYCVQVSEYPCVQLCGGWNWAEGPGDIGVTYLTDLDQYIDFALTGTDEDQTQYPERLTRMRPGPALGAVSCWLPQDGSETKAEQNSWEPPATVRRRRRGNRRSRLRRQDSGR